MKDGVAGENVGFWLECEKKTSISRDVLCDKDTLFRTINLKLSIHFESKRRGSRQPFTSGFSHNFIFVRQM